MLGSFVFGIIADKYGRQRVIMASAVVNTIFGIFTAFAPVTIGSYSPALSSESHSPELPKGE